MQRNRLFWFLLLSVACSGNGLQPAGEPPGSNGFVPQPRGPFPEHFLWGSVISPYQVEGDLHQTDWHYWEGLCDKCDGARADEGPRFWEHYLTDLDNAAAISTNAIRLGLDWSRLFPTRQAFTSRSPDADALARYHDIIGAARERGLAVMVTLVHFTLPVWIHDPRNQGSARGWEDPAIIENLAAFAGWAAAEFGGEVDHWITIHEPLIQAFGGWISGHMPPGRSADVDTALQVIEIMMWAHARAYDAIHAADLHDADGDGSAVRVAVATQSRAFLPVDPSDPDHVAAADLFRYVFNAVFLRAVVFGNLDRNYDMDYDDPGDVRDDESLKGRIDFLGLDYYGVTLVRPIPGRVNYPFAGTLLSSDLGTHGLDAPMSDLGWSIYPQGLRHAIDELSQYERPIILTANGVADGADTLRPRFVIDHLYVVNQAIDEGIDIRGYFHDSLMDKFEWSSGYCPRLGLFRVDFGKSDRPRSMTAGAEAYSRVIEAGTVLPELFTSYPGYQTEGFCPRLGL
jgi:beta-glucosidase/6-phospho-beta-glucosidase/beta-galactosidase